MNEVVEIIEKLNNISMYFRCQDIYTGNIEIMSALDDINLILQQEYTQSYVQSILETLKNILDTQENKNYILLSDLIDLNLIPILKEILLDLGEDNLLSKDYFASNIALLKENVCGRALIEKIKNRYQVLNKTNHTLGDLKIEITGCGMPTLCRKGYYYHSNDNPLREAELIINNYVVDDEIHYVIYGFGLGYMTEALMKNDSRFDVVVIENNIDTLVMAFTYRNLKTLLESERFSLEFVREEDMSKCFNDINGKVMIIHYPTLYNIMNPTIKEVINDYFINVGSIYRQKDRMDASYYYNMMNNDKEISCVIDSFANKKVLYIGGGPSCEYYLAYIRKCRNNCNYLITCASTVYKKLVENSIIPDFVFMIDAALEMKEHVNGVKNTGSKLLYLCTASFDAVKAFNGERYIMFQNGNKHGEMYAKEHGYTTYDTGGSVSTIAIDIILKSKAESLITIGIDYAYTFGKDHSFSDIANNMDEGFIKVKSVDGDEVYTTKVLDIYRKWTVRRLKGEKKTVINLSKGAYIEGAVNTSVEPEV